MKSFSEQTHKPVLINDIKLFIEETSSSFDTHNTLRLFDGTFGAGGYTHELLELGTVTATDSDSEAVLKGIARFENEISEGRLTLLHERFDKGISQLEDNSLHYCIVDLGFSSTQLDYSKRGFSYLKSEEVLDLRYNETTGKPCWKLLKSVKTVDNLRKTIYQYSGETHSKNIAQRLFDLSKSKDKEEPVLVAEAVSAIKSAIPNKEKKKSNAILSRVWQALRIWTNNEFEVLQNFLNDAIHKLVPGGYLMVVSFHSLEDKIVTKFMRLLSQPVETDEYGNKTFQYELITKKAITPSEEEVEYNTRSRSAMLRILKKY
jgi:16S rRNA (cytosine1402-N4)-methyltransferase